MRNKQNTRDDAKQNHCSIEIVLCAAYLPANTEIGKITLFPQFASFEPVRCLSYGHSCKEYQQENKHRFPYCHTYFLILKFAISSSEKRLFDFIRCI